MGLVSGGVLHPGGAEQKSAPADCSECWEIGSWERWNYEFRAFIRCKNRFSVWSVDVLSWFLRFIGTAVTLSRVCECTSVSDERPFDLPLSTFSPPESNIKPTSTITTLSLSNSHFDHSSCYL